MPIPFNHPSRNVFLTIVSFAVFAFLMPGDALSHREGFDKPECHSPKGESTHCHFAIDPEWKNLKGASVEKMRACLSELARQCGEMNGGQFCARNAGRLCRSLGRGMKG